MVSAEAYERKHSHKQASIEQADEKVHARSRQVPDLRKVETGTRSDLG